MDPSVPKPRLQTDYKDLKDLKKEDSKTINALPDFEIRTMKGDLAGLGVKKLDKTQFLREKSPVKAPDIVPPVPKKPQGAENIPQEEEIPEEIETKTEIAQKPESGIIVPENLPIIPAIKKSAMPSTEELVRKEPESPLAPLPPQKSETFFEVPETPPIETRPAPQITNAESFPQMDRMKIPEPVYAPEKAGIRKVLRLAIIGLILIVVAGGGAYFYLKNKPSSEIVPTTPTVTEPELSSALISVEQKKIIHLTDQQTLFAALREEIKSAQAINTFTRIGILKTLATGEPTTYFSLSELFQGLGITVSPYALSEMKDNYNLLLFNQETGKRLGIVIETNNPADLKNQMKTWEPTMLDDFKNFYPMQAPGQSVSKDFLDDNYKNVIIRYKNLPYSTLTLNYTVLGNYLVIGTSKEMIYTVIDRILAQ